MASDFIKEKIKDKPVDKKKLARHIGMTVLIAVIFGVVSAVTFSIVYAHIKPAEKVSIKPVEFPEPENTPDDPVSVSETGVSPDSVEASVSEDVTVSSDAVTISEDAVAETTVSAPSTVINNITNKIDITPEKYARLYKSLHEVAVNAGKSLVTVTGTTTDTDWFENPYENGHSTIGLIVADNGKQLLVLADSSVTTDAEEISVIFSDGQSAPARVMNTDTDTGLQIISTELSDISEETLENITYASLGASTYTSTVGTPVIAVGSPLGISDSEAHGLITSMSQEQEMSDFNVHLLTTDISGSDNASGVIINYSGQVLGIITTAYKDRNIANKITAYSISDIK
ncbi:MAG: trypsin-like peptidase domain-containing protein, partial [Lachnospiraceae bacterium]|nr:trypsin-like peptidase domain-containing protein [Lachnospiraceae bacterium]